MSSKLKVNNIIPSTGTQIGISTTGGGINLLTGTVVTGIITASGFDGPITQSGDFTIDDYVVHAGDTDTKLGFPAADQIQFDTGGTNYLKLHRYASVNFVEVGSAAQFSFANNGANGRSILIGDANASSTGSMHLQAGGGSTGFGGGIRLYSHANSTNAGGVYIGKSLNSSGSIIFGNGGTSPNSEYVRITSAGNIGIGTATADKSLTIGGTTPVLKLNDANGRILELRGGSTSHNPSLVTQYSSKLYLGCNGTESVNIGQEHLTIANGDLIIGTSGHGITALGANSSTYGELKVEVAASDFSGSNNVATFKRGSNGAINLAFPSGGGIDFSATSDGPSGVNELLDDYEEGSYTPAVTAGYSAITYHNPRIGYYTRVGNHVSFQIYLYVYQATGAAAEINISLPFTSANNTGRETGAYTCYTNGFFSNSSGDKAHCTYLIGQNYSYLRPCKSTNGAVIYGNDTYLGTGANNRYLVIAGQMFV